jgi:hypothetical protein
MGATFDRHGGVYLRGLVMNGYDLEQCGDLGFRKLSTIDLWRLSDSLNVVDAAILITGNDPSTQDKLYDDDRGVKWGQKVDYAGFEPTLKALKSAILGNKLKAVIKHSMRGFSSESDPHGDYSYEIVQMPNEETVSYDMLVARMDTTPWSQEPLKGKTALNFSVSDIKHTGNLYICKDPNWQQTLVEVEDLKEWLASKSLRPEFFFPDAPVEGFRNKNHSRYSAKLATAVAAWEAVKTASPNKTPKQTLKAWVQSNGEKFGLTDDGIVSDGMAEEIAIIANWQTKGGATPTSTNDSPPPTQQEEPIENYPHSYSPSEKTIDIDDPDIPF